MQIERKVLLEALKAAKAGLASKATITAFLCFWFDGKHVTAYNDVIGIEVPLKTDFRGGVNGSLLLGLVAASLAKNAEITEGKDHLGLKLAGHRSRLPILPPADAVWAFPEAPDADPWAFKSDFPAALAHIRLAAKEDFGVCFIPKDGSLGIYATDRVSVAWATIPFGKKAPFTGKFVLPLPFCEELIAVCGDGGELFVQEDSVVVVANNGIRIFSRLLDPAAAPDFVGNLKRLLPENAWTGSVDIPGKLGPALDRVKVLIGDAGEKTTFEVAGNELILSIKVPAGELTERMALDQKHKSLVVRSNSERVQKGLVKDGRFLITDDCVVIMPEKTRGYVVSVMA